MIKRGNLARDLKMWLMSTLQLGPGIGDVFYLCPAASATSNYRQWLVNQGVDGAHIFATLADAYAAVTDYRNDVICVFPGNYLETATLLWTKNFVHLVGVGGSNFFSDWSLLGTTIYTTGIAIDYVINLTGKRNTFHNLCINNYGANAACLSPVKVNSYGNSFFKTAFLGIMNSTQIATAGCSSLEIGANGAYSIFEDCTIGQMAWGARTSITQGHLLYSGAGGNGPSEVEFRNCIFKSWAETAGVPMIYIPNTWGADHLERYKDCLFYNFWTNWGNKCTSVFKWGSSIATQSHVLENCTGVGYTYWQAAGTGECVVTAMPITATGGGLGRIPTAAVGS